MQYLRTKTSNTFIIPKINLYTSKHFKFNEERPAIRSKTSVLTTKACSYVFTFQSDFELCIMTGNLGTML